MKTVQKNPVKARGQRRQYKLVFPSGEVKLGMYYNDKQALGHLLTLCSNPKTGKGVKAQVNPLFDSNRYNRRCVDGIAQQSWKAQVQHFTDAHYAFLDEWNNAYECYNFPFIADFRYDEEHGYIGYWNVITRSDFKDINLAPSKIDVYEEEMSIARKEALAEYKVLRLGL